MRLWVALTLCVVPCLPAAARDLSVSATWDTPISAEVVTVLHLADGSIGMTVRSPVGPDVTMLDQLLTDLPRLASSVQIALITPDRIVAQSAPTALDRLDAPLSLTLQPVLALGLQARFDCADLGLANLSTQGQVTRLSLTREGAETARLLSSGGDLTAPDGMRARVQGTVLTVTARDGAETHCPALPAPPVLPVTARAQDDAWSIALDVGTASVTLPQGTLPDGTPIAPVDAGQAESGAIVFRSAQFTLTLRAGACLRGADAVPYPLSARLELPQAVASDGCAGSPLDLLVGSEWYATTLLGLPVAQDLTLGFVAGQVAGRGTCNRYQANVVFDAGQMDLRDLGTTRVGCPTALRNLELRFLDALEQATGFNLGADGTLILRSGPMPVLTARQRAVLR